MSTIRTIVWIVLLVICICCTKQAEPVIDTDWQRWGLRGHVKSLVEIAYSESGKYRTVIFFNETGHVTEQASYNPDASLIRKWVFTYRTDQKKDKLFCYILKDSLAYTLTYHYDIKDNLLSIEIEKPDGQTGVQSVMEYDAKNHKVKESRFDIQGALEYETSYKYESDRLAEESFHDAVLRRKWKQVNHYDAAGKKDETIQMSMADSVSGKMKFEYDAAGQLLATSTFDAADRLISKVSHRYTLNDDEEERIHTLPGDTISDIRRQQYRYDKNTNWIFTNLTVNDKPADIITREIVYFE